MKTNKELRAMAREQLKGSWLEAVGILLIFCVIIGASAFVVIGPLVLCGPLVIGFLGYFIKKARREPAKLENLFDGFKIFGPSFLLYLIQL